MSIKKLLGKLFNGRTIYVCLIDERAILKVKIKSNILNKHDGNIILIESYDQYGNYVRDTHILVDLLYLQNAKPFLKLKSAIKFMESHGWVVSTGSFRRELFTGIYLPVKECLTQSESKFYKSLDDDLPF